MVIWNAFAGELATPPIAPDAADAFVAIVEAAARAHGNLAVDPVAFAGMLGKKLRGSPDPLAVLQTLDEALCSDGAENSWASKSGTGLTWGFDNGAWNTARMVTPCNVGQALLCFERAAP